MNRPILTAVLLATALSAAACGGGDSEPADNAQTPAAADSPAVTVTGVPAAADSPAAAPAMAGSGFLDPNTASREELLTVPGMTPQLADAVVAGRPYQDMRGVNAKLTGLTDAQRDSVYTRLWKPLDLNTATAEEIELIPNVGARMRHEFEEYRPYRGIEQFRREIGKYVDEAEVARLERYVTIAGS